MKSKRHPIEQVSPSPVRLMEVPPCAPEEVASHRPPAEDPMKCVWSGYPSYERTCRSRIPASVVVKAWQRERHLKGSQEGFFYFSWRSGVWLAFGAQDGSVRGVYCPTHCSERDAREGPADGALQ
jgi:hypothetical protein